MHGTILNPYMSDGRQLVFRVLPGHCFRWAVLVFRLLVLHNRATEVTMSIKVDDIADGLPRSPWAWDQ